MALSQYGKIETVPANKYTWKFGTFAWTSTNATGDLPAQGLKVVIGCFFTPIGAYAVADGIRVVETLDGDGNVQVGADGTIAVARDTGGTSAGKVKYALYGY